MLPGWTSNPAPPMSVLFLKAILSVVIGALGMPVGMLPSILLFRGLANGVDGGVAVKRAYGIVLWGGILLGWAACTAASWWLLSALVQA